MDKTRVAQLRKEKGWTQEELAEKAYLTVRTIQRMEAGQDVSLTTLSSVAKAFSLPLSDLFDHIEEEQREIEVMEYSQEQEEQVRQRRAEKNAMLFLVMAVDFLLLSLLGYPIGQLPDSKQSLPGILWTGMLFLVMAASIYFLKVFWARHLDKKYPKSIGYKRVIDRRPVQNGWDFAARYWWIVFPIGGFLFGILSAVHGVLQ
ncbi:helix-turn-helix domain-containing protein [Fructobacillus papyrifericola]|uniref:Helix-turn-helix domain-containing protein n=1 Tax=Fructobacillus papyrifericola TaxID=2713172 RepID=A0ABS5QT50_9LACO|nr:helix-turn-helix domain-containing protein [Fructobacillus papyrifericola]MBS9336369.1 helix-turn-helix domain-containing protein [Fructobacillus papyrifericola]